MGKVLLDLAVSLDGYIDGPDGADVGLYDWYAATSGSPAIPRRGAARGGPGLTSVELSGDGWPWDGPA